MANHPCLEGRTEPLKLLVDAHSKSSQHSSQWSFQWIQSVILIIHTSELGVASRQASIAGQALTRKWFAIACGWIKMPADNFNSTLLYKTKIIFNSSTKRIKLNSSLIIFTSNVSINQKQLDKPSWKIWSGAEVFWAYKKKPERAAQRCLKPT